jgi:hypothetical protein
MAEYVRFTGLALWSISTTRLRVCMHRWKGLTGAVKCHAPHLGKRPRSTYLRRTLSLILQL